MTDTDVDERFRRRVAWVRSVGGLTKEALVLRLGDLGWKVHGDRSVKIGEAVLLAEALGVSLGELLADEPLTITHQEPAR